MFDIDGGDDGLGYEACARVLVCSSDRWSASGLQGNLQHVTSCVQNVMLFMQLFSYVLVDEMHRALPPELTGCFPAKASSSQVSGAALEAASAGAVEEGEGDFSIVWCM